MRGKLLYTHSGHLSTRITPADAGKTENPSGNPLWAGDHPRGCGENTLLNAIQYALGEDHPRGCGENASGGKEGERADGSPPRMRGKQSSLKAHNSCERITPADAGKTSRA